MSWVTGPGTGRTAHLPNDWLPSKAQGGKFLTAGSVSEGVSIGTSFLSVGPTTALAR